MVDTYCSLTHFVPLPGHPSLSGVFDSVVFPRVSVTVAPQRLNSTAGRVEIIAESGMVARGWAVVEEVGYREEKYCFSTDILGG